MPIETIQTVHSGHSSVGVLANGQCVEIRRGSQRLFNIPSPMIWNSLQEWYATIPYIGIDLLQRPLPAHFNADQASIFQWHEHSTLRDIMDINGYIAQHIVAPASVMILDGYTGSMQHLYMDIETGTMYCQGATFKSFAESPFQVTQVWRAEGGVYYRVS